MRIFEERYFNINRRFLMCLGLWPYEMKAKKIFLRAIIIGVLTLFTIPEIISMLVHYKNIDRLMMSIIGFTSLTVVNIKVIAMMLSEENMKILHRSIANNWHLIKDENERKILCKYSERARSMTIFYAAALIITTAIGPAFPLIPKCLDILKPLENPRPNFYVLEAEYLIDREANFTLVFFLNYITMQLIVFSIVSIDTMYLVSSEHCCALYAIVRHRLFKLRRIVQESSLAIENGDSYEWLRHTIQLHQNALSFVTLLNNSYSAIYMCVLIAALYVIPLSSCAIIANLHNPILVFPFVSYLGASMIHGFCLVFPGQRIIDHQVTLPDSAYCNEWYATPLRTRKLLLIFMLRCSQIPTVTAGDLVSVNFELYFKIVKTAASYITVAASFR